MEWLRDVTARSSAGEIAGVVVIVVASVVLLVSAVRIGAGDVLAAYGVLLGFTAGITGLGVHSASRQARFRREGR
ncbi:hypothetical protein SAMN06295885_3111 [Rathayibacter oskolensis]|uniref:Uncharacterized protein n=1 Tax=Rathayibacter oskolensis TaxID=1891671 RepID=A0A1X7PBR6_9MICO|nr:hypothetical protein SAMN06295885_3111 [Rathayibacter oskolensis]